MLEKEKLMKISFINIEKDSKQMFTHCAYYKKKKTVLRKTHTQLKSIEVDINIHVINLYGGTYSTSILIILENS